MKGIPPIEATVVYPLLQSGNTSAKIARERLLWCKRKLDGGYWQLIDSTWFYPSSERSRALCRWQWL